MPKQLFNITLSVSLAFWLITSASAQLLPGAGRSALGGSDRPRPLPLDQAFPFFVSIIDADTLEITWQIAPDHYLYRHQFNFSLQLPTTAEQQPVSFQLPDGIAKTDQFFGAIEAYYEGVTARLSVEPALPAGTSLIVEYQGCADWGFCYPPQTTAYALSP
jgi:thiol:disulfide interchange protein DsbD